MLIPILNIDSNYYTEKYRLPKSITARHYPMQYNVHCTGMINVPIITICIIYCYRYYQKAGVKVTESSKLTKKQLHKLASRLTKAYGLNIGTCVHNNFSTIFG